MAAIFTEIKRKFDAGSIAAKFIYINAGIFLIIRLLMIFLKLFLIKEPPFLAYLGTPSSLELLLHRPWTIITYMFVHFDFLHILLNMLWLYWFGKIFLQFFTGRQLGGLYVLGGLAGAMFYLIAYNIFPYFLEQHPASSFLNGASASIMAIVFAVSFYRKNYDIHLLFIGKIKLIYLAVAVLLLDIIAVTSENAGGHIAHIGGALFGILFAVQYQKGKDITRFMNRMIDGLVNLSRRKPTFKIRRPEKKPSPNKKNRPETDAEYIRRKNEERRTIDEILDKLKHSGYESLSADEKKKLFEASKN